MVIHDWGQDQPPAPIASVNAAPLDAPAEDLPEIQALAAEGWHLLPHDAPMWQFLPAVWPRAHRTWVPDRSTRYYSDYVDGHFVAHAPWTPAMLESVESDINTRLIAAGLSPRPPRRLWLARLPEGFRSLDDLLQNLAETAERRGVEPFAQQAFIRVVGEHLAALFAAS